MKDICIIAPMLLSLDYVDEFVKNIKQIDRKKYNVTATIFYVDDLPKKYSKNKNIKFVKAEYSDDFDSCITKGFLIADADAVVVFDATDKNAYQNLKNAISKFENGAEIVFVKKRREPNNFFSKFFRLLYSKMLTSAKLDAELFVHSNFGLFSKRASNIIKSFPEKNYYLRNFDCFVDYNIQFLEFQKAKRMPSKNAFNMNLIMFALSFALSFASLLILIFGVNSVNINNQAIFVMIGISLTFAGLLFGLYNFYIWFLQKRTRLLL